MKPIKFSQQNCTYAENQPEYLPLPAYKNLDGLVVTCWKLTLIERIQILFIGKIWLSVLTFSNPLQPLRLTTKNPT